MKCLLTTLLCLTVFFTTVKAEDIPSSEIINFTSYRQVKDGKLIISDSVRIQINNREGDKSAAITIPYSKGDKVTIGDAWIEDMDGNIIRKLKSKEITDRSSISNISLYEDDFVKEFELKHNEYPYQIVYSCRSTYNKFLQIVSANYTNNRSTIRNAKFVVETPIDFEIKSNRKNIKDYDIETVNNIRRHTWTFTHTPKDWERNASINNSDAPQLTVVPLIFSYGKPGSFESWNTFGNWLYRLNENKDILPPSEKQKIDVFLLGITDKKEKIRKLYHYLQDYNRYINVVIDLGGLQTYSAEYVSTNHYGDCKALSNYMLAMLKYAEIESFYTTIYSDDKVIDIDPELAHQAFNHVILTVPLEQDTIFLECTSNTLPMGYIHSSIQGRKALCIAENNSHLIDIPRLTSKDVLCNRDIESTLNQDKGGLADIKLTHRGEFFEYSNYIAGNSNKDRTDKYFLQNMPSGSFELKEASFDKQSRDSLAIKINATLKIHNLYKKFGNNIAITPYPFKIQTFENPEKRKTDLQIDYPSYAKDTFIYEIPADSISKVPKNILIPSPYGYYAIKFESKGNKLYVYKSMLVNAGRYNLEQYTEFFNFLQKIKNIELKNYYIETL